MLVRHLMPCYEKSALSDALPHFFTPWYSSTVLDDMVVVTFDVSETCVYVAVVLIVLHALHEVMPTLTATQTIATNMNKSLFIVLLVLVNKFLVL